MSATLNTGLTEKKLSSSVESKLTPVVDQTIFFLKTSIIISTTVLLLASAWV